MEYIIMQDSDRRPLLNPMSNFYVTDMCTSGLCPFEILKSASNSQIYVLFQILKSAFIIDSMAVSHFLKSVSNDVTDVCPNPNQYIGHRYENLERTPIWEYP
jgi:hypothetical protein